MSLKGIKKVKRFKRKACVMTIVLSLLLCFVVSPVTFADELDDKKSELSDINSDIENLEKQLKEGQSKTTSLQKEIKTVENKIYSAQKKLNNLTASVNDTKLKINETLIELAQLQSEIDIQNENLDARLRSMYKNGDIGLLSVLLGSKSMSDFLTNMEMVKRIYNSDEILLEDMQTAYDVVLKKKEELAELKTQLVAQQEEVTQYKKGLSESEDKLAAQKKQVENDNKALEAQIDSLNAEADKLVAEILKLQSSDAYTGGVMCWPSKASSRVTSKFGYRLHPILKVNKLHTGIDIGAGKGTDILAANSGRVIKAAYNAGGYGYYIMIDHGGGIVTLYAHSSKLLVSQGDVVARGQTIAKVGSTGMSTGPHLHFEVRINGAYVNPLDYVTPGKY